MNVGAEDCMLKDAVALQLQPMIAEDSPLRPTDVKLLTVVQRDDIGSARHRADAAHHFYIGERAASESDEMRRIEAGFQVLEAIRKRVSFVPRRRQMKQLPVGDN